MRDFFTVCYLAFLQAVSMTLLGLGGACNSAGQLFHIFFTRIALKADQGFKAKEPGPKEEPSIVVQVVDDTEGGSDGDWN